MEGRLALLKYWIEERENIRTRKEAGLAKPWTADWVFQKTYFTNINREDDKVTKWIRNFYAEKVIEPYFELNIALARWLNWPETLREVGFVDTADFGRVRRTLDALPGKVFGNAYVVSTNGLAMPKSQYVTEVLLPAAFDTFGPSGGWRIACTGSLAAAYKSLLGVHGFGSFMAGQVLADLKNTIGHPLTQAHDWWDFVVPGPGSVRGVNWIFNGNPDRRAFSKFEDAVERIRQYLAVDLQFDLIDTLCNQNLQNCLCEFDKYCRVYTGQGLSKRSYNGY